MILVVILVEPSKTFAAGLLISNGVFITRRFSFDARPPSLFIESPSLFMSF